MKPSWEIGAVVAVLISIAAGLLGLELQAVITMILILVGLWTLLAAFVIVDRKDRNYYTGWGVVITGLSLSYFVKLQYALALIILAIVAVIIINVYIGKTPRMYEAATNPTPAGGGTPAAT